MKIGDKVICTLDVGYNKYITNGKEYYVNKYLDSYYPQIEIITNSGNLMWFFADRFDTIHNSRRMKLEKIKKRICNQVIK